MQDSAGAIRRAGTQTEYPFPFLIAGFTLLRPSVARVIVRPGTIHFTGLC
jgi:hypothetical protein